MPEVTWQRGIEVTEVIKLIGTCLGLPGHYYHMAFVSAMSQRFLQWKKEERGSGQSGGTLPSGVAFLDGGG